MERQRWRQIASFSESTHEDSESIWTVLHFDAVIGMNPRGEFKLA
jgi:hypothetical protein